MVGYRRKGQITEKSLFNICSYHLCYGNILCCICLHYFLRNYQNLVVFYILSSQFYLRQFAFNTKNKKIFNIDLCQVFIILSTIIKIKKIKFYGSSIYLIKCFSGSNQVDCWNNLFPICNGVSYWSNSLLAYDLWRKENLQKRRWKLEIILLDCSNPYHIVINIGIIGVSNYLMASVSDAFFILLYTIEPILFESFLKCSDMSCIH